MVITACRLAWVLGLSFLQGTITEQTSHRRGSDDHTLYEMAGVAFVNATKELEPIA